MNPYNVPTATYRLQFNREFTFTDAVDIVSYLHTLGISHVYASPFLKARAGSLHGYNIVDHNALNPEIGDETDFSNYVEKLHQCGMGQVIDIVPNHMGVGGDDNHWWLHVLENGESSVYAAYFDIDWRPANPALHNKILLPFLGDHYGTILENGELKLEFDRDNGAFGVRYYEHLFPIDPHTYPQILSLRFDVVAQKNTHLNHVFEKLGALIFECKSLPRRTDLSSDHRQQRHEGIVACKRRLAALGRDHPEIFNFIQENVACFNGTAGQPSSFNRLHHLLETQAYRLSYWKVATEEINYRRFFDINELAAISIENDEVFEVTHRLIRRLIRDGQINGLRIDHPDGLFDPCAYYHHLQRMIQAETVNLPELAQASFGLWIEKILANFENLPADWPVSGTTGYEAAFLLNGVFIRQQSERQMNRIYNRFIGLNLNFEELLYDRKKLITRRILSSELTVLANLLSNIAQTNRQTRDFTYQALRDALSEIVACFPVYRTYITAEHISEEDLRYVQWSIAQAKKRSPAADTLIYDFIESMLTLVPKGHYSEHVRRKIVQFVLKFQQYTSPVMAKGMEDTTFYIYNRLVSLNDVGFNPCAFGISVAAFHQSNLQRLSGWPRAMVTSSTHDSKRNEDVRARINVLSEIPDEWRRHLNRWSMLNQSKKRLVNDEHAPSRNDEYLIYQTLIGAWPVETLNTIEALEDTAAREAFRARIEAYMLKAAKEAKVQTSWINPNEEYEEAIRYFVNALFDHPARNAFLTDFLPFQKRIARFGLFNSLSQILLKLTVPGIPDIYQGNELWMFSLVDPDNRRPVDYSLRRTILETLIKESEQKESLSGFAHQLLQQIDDGRAKLYLTWRVLTLRRQCPEVFDEGKYTGLAAQGSRADHICAFARSHEGQEVIVVAARECVPLAPGDDDLPIGQSVWEDTRIEAPKSTTSSTTSATARSYRNILTGERITAVTIEEQSVFYAAQLLRNFSVALLISE